MLRLIGLLVIVMSFMALSGCTSCKESHGKKHGHKHHRMWEKMDANNDGVLSREEFDKAHADSFDKMDANSDGKITKEEMKAHHKSMKEAKKGCCK